jgi:hypothetical protein
MNGRLLEVSIPCAHVIGVCARRVRGTEISGGATELGWASSCYPPRYWDRSDPNPTDEPKLADIYMHVGQAVSGTNQHALQWNPKAGQWFCLGCFQTSKQLSRDEAERELQQFQCDTGESSIKETVESPFAQ